MLGRPTSDTLLERLDADGNVLRFDMESGYFVRGTVDGHVIEVDRPFSGIDYWKKHP